MNACPCCSFSLLRHIRRDRLYWYCSRCRLEIPHSALVNQSEQVFRENYLDRELAKSVL
jgi:ribosomal protein L37AE/L43A